MEANTINPDQNVPKGAVSDLRPYYLQYRLPKNLSRGEEQTTKVMTGGKRINP